MLDKGSKLEVLMKLMKMLHMLNKQESQETPEDEAAESPEVQGMEDKLGLEQHGEEKPKGVAMVKESLLVPGGDDEAAEGEDDEESLEKLKKRPGYLGKL